MKHRLAVLLLLLPGAAVAQVPAPDRGQAVVAGTCGQCHPLSQVTQQHRSAEQWSDTVTRMIANGAQVSDGDFQAVVDYLAAHYGPVGP